MTFYRKDEFNKYFKLQFYIPVCVFIPIMIIKGTQRSVQVDHIKNQEGHDTSYQYVEWQLHEDRSKAWKTWSQAMKGRLDARHHGHVAGGKVGRLLLPSL